MRRIEWRRGDFPVEAEVKRTNNYGLDDSLLRTYEGLLDRAWGPLCGLVARLAWAIGERGE